MFFFVLYRELPNGAHNYIGVDARGQEGKGLLYNITHRSIPMRAYISCMVAHTWFLPMLIATLEYKLHPGADPGFRRGGGGSYRNLG